MYLGVKKINSILNGTTKVINQIIKKLAASYVDKKFQKIVQYQVLTGGKRMRSTLAIISCKLLGGKIKNVLYPAAGLEILHNYSLIVDDMIDNSRIRRGKPTTWAKFGKPLAQCAAGDLLVTIFQAANRSPKSIEISELFARTMKTIVNGEILDIFFEETGKEFSQAKRYQKIEEKDYFEMIGKKTATFFQACCEIGGIVALAKKREIKAIKDYGFNLGMAFQIQDDILDIFGQEKAFGKKIGKDIQERKGGNIAILFALKELNLTDRKKLLGILRKEKVSQRDIWVALKLIKKTKSHQRAYQLCQKFGQKAKKALESLPKNKWNETLRAFADFVIERQQ